MGMADLRAYVAHLQRNELNSDRLRTAFWSRLARLASVLLVLMLALPFALGSLRNAGQGARTVIGVLIGAGFILLSQDARKQRAIIQPATVGRRLVAHDIAGRTDEHPALANPLALARGQHDYARARQPVVPGALVAVDEDP